jgi:hypothetical protein
MLAVGFVASCLVGAPTAAASLPIPVAKLSQMKRQIRGPVFVPTLLPKGYRFVSWTLLSPLGAPNAGGWYSVTFKRGAKKLRWTVGIQQGSCGDLSDGRRGSLYWLLPGLDGRDAWQCIASGQRRLKIDLFDFRPVPFLSLSQTASILSSAHRA